MPRVYITYPIPTRGIEILTAQGYEVTTNQNGRPLSHTELVGAVQNADALLCMLTDKIDRSIIEAAGPQLKIIANYAVGVDNIDLTAAHEKNIIVTNTPDILSEAVGEHTLGLMLGLSRRIVESDQFVRDGKFTGWLPELFLGTELWGKTLGIIGMGRIGQRVAKICHRGLNMQILYVDQVDRPEINEELDAHKTDLTSLLKESDVVSIHVPLTEETRHMIGRDQIMLMKKSAYLINTARGAIVNVPELVSALENKVIAGAALDVYEQEPKLTAGLTALSNVILTPHIASSSRETRTAMAEIAAKNICSVLDGNKALTPVN